jgi:tetratricopeptide (TPR) repeat protein
LRLIARFRGEAGAVANAAAIAWVQSHPEQALLLAAEAARMAPDDANAVNTLAALLAQAGYEEKAIPLLRHLAERHPQDTSILSNLAVAWLNLGETEEAGKIVLRVLALAPGHGVANLTAGLIAESEGRHDAAREHLRKAAASNSSPQARDLLRQRGQSYRAPPGFFAMLPKKEYFGPGAFEPVRPQRNLAEYGVKLAEKKATDAALLKAITAEYKHIQEETGAVMQEAMRGQVRGGAAVYAKLDWKNALNYLNHEEKLVLAQERLVARMLQIRELRVEYERTRTPGAAEDPTPMCERRRPIAQAALARMTEEYEKLVGETLFLWRDVTNSRITLQRFMLQPAAYRVSFHGNVAAYLEFVRKLNEELPLLEDPCAGQNPGKWPGYELVPPGAGECPFSLKVDAIVAELEMDCHKFGFSFKAGLAFSATKEFASGETTLTAGLGLEADLHDLGKAEGSAQMVMVWDRANELSFVGVESTAEAKLSGIPGLGGKLAQEAVGPGGENRPDFSKDLVKVGVKTRLGVEIGPRGFESSISGEAGGQLLGQDIFKAEIP